MWEPKMLLLRALHLQTQVLLGSKVATNPNMPVSVAACSCHTY